MQTHIRVDADGSALGVGYDFDPLDLKLDKILRCGYLLVSPPPEGSLRLLETWTCPTCETEQWGMVTIDRGRVQAVEAVQLDRASLDLATFISEVDAEIVADGFRDRGETVVETLRRNLK